MGCCWMSVSNESGNHAHLWQWLWCCACVQSSPYQTCQEMSRGGHASSRRSVSHGQVCRLVQLHTWSILSILYTAPRRWDYARVFFTPERLFQPAVFSIIPSQCSCCCLIARRDLRSHTPRQIHNAGGGRAIWPCNADRTARGQNPKLCTTIQASTPDYLMKKRGTKDEKDRRKNEKEEKNWEERGKQVGTAAMKNKERPTPSNQRCAVDDVIIIFLHFFSWQISGEEI